MRTTGGLFRDLPIRLKVVLLIAVSSAVGLGLAALAVVIYELTTFRPRVLRDATTQAAIVRINTIPALRFDDPSAATENLASLSSRREIGAAAVWRPDGRLFASYQRLGTAVITRAAPDAAGARFDGSKLTLAERIESDEELVGWLTLQYQLPPLLERLPQYAIMVGVVALALGTAAALLLGMLGSEVSTPLLRLAGTARSITASRDFRIRIPPGSADEIGTLSAAWNEMLATIEQSQGALQDSELRLRLALEGAAMETVVIELNELGNRSEGRDRLFEAAHPDDRPIIERALRLAPASGGKVDIEFRAPGRDNSWRALRGQIAPDGRLLGVMQDVTQRRRLELQLIQAQKMEAIGNLAGGIAHDFNNLLTAIIGHLRFVQRDLPGGTQLRADVDEAERAAQRAAELTSQLLSYARRQMVVPAVVDMSVGVRALEPMLGRLLGEDIQVVLNGQPGLWLTRVDPHQIGQVVINLAVNARDAMPSGGRLLISTSNVTTGTSDGAAGDADPRPGDYVQLSVSDTGVGIAPDVLPLIFEPFFTTKPPGAGTGLGLAMCYGVVKQGGGHISVQSEEGRGTTFTILLPRVVAEAPDRPTGVPPDPMPPGTETVLVVEDDEMVRTMAVRALRLAGYTVLEAEGGEAALACSEQHQGVIDVLLTDVVMPGLKGGDLAEMMVARRPDIRVIYMSGYTQDSAIQRGTLDARGLFMSKPFTPAGIARAVRSALDRPLGRTHADGAPPSRP